MERAQDKHSEAELQTVLAGILTELRPDGLKSLELTGPDEQGERFISAEASPAKKVAKTGKKPNAKRTGTLLTATLTLKSDALATLEAQRGRPYLFTPGIVVPRLRTADVKGQVQGPQTATQIGEAAQGQSKVTTFLVKPEAGSNEVKMYSYNTGDPIRLANTSHAEHQLLNLLTPRLLRQLVDLKIAINNSPCSQCAAELAALKRAHPFTASLSYSIVYDGYDENRILKDNVTTVEDISILTAAGWSVTGDPAPRWTNASRQEEIKVGTSWHLQRV
jgi:hypothetical protein